MRPVAWIVDASFDFLCIPISNKLMYFQILHEDQDKTDSDVNKNLFCV